MLENKKITWPHDRSFLSSTLHIGSETPVTLSNHPFRKLKDDSMLGLVGSSFEIKKSDDVILVDLNKFHDSDSKFSISVDIKFSRGIDWTKARNIITFGTHIAGTDSKEITIGTPGGSINNTLPVIGLIGKNPEDTLKSELKDGITTAAYGLSDDGETKYTFSVAYNPQSTDKEKLLLFVKKTDEGEFVLYSSLDGLDLDLYNLNIANKRMLIGTSGWTNEPTWNKKLDFCPLTLTGVEFNTNQINYPSGYIEDKYSITNSEFIVVNTPDYTKAEGTHLYLSDAAGSKLIYKFKSEFVSSIIDVGITDNSSFSNTITFSYEGIDRGYYVCSANTFPKNFFDWSNVNIEFDGQHSFTVAESNITDQNKHFIVDNVAPTDVKVQLDTASNSNCIVKFMSVQDGAISNVDPGISGFSYSNNSFYNEAFVESYSSINATLPNVYGKDYTLYVFGLTDSDFGLLSDIQELDVSDITAITSFRSAQGPIDTNLNLLNIGGLSYTEDLRAFAYVIDHMNNKSEYFPILDSHGSNIFFIGDIYPPYISFSNVHTDKYVGDSKPYIRIDGIAYDEQTNYNVYAMISKSNMDIVEDLVSLSNLFATQIDQKLLIEDGNHGNSIDGAFSNLVVNKEWNGTEFVDLLVDTYFYVYMVIKDDGARSDDIYTKYGSSVIFQQDVHSLSLTSSNVLSFTSHQTEQIAITGDTVTINWTTNLQENPSTTIQVGFSNFFLSDAFSFSNGNSNDQYGNTFTIDETLSRFSYTYNVLSNTPKGKLEVKIKKNETDLNLSIIDDINDTCVFVQQDLLLEHIWNVSANSNDNLAVNHNELLISGYSTDSFIDTVFNTLNTLADCNYDIKFGFPFDLSISSLEDDTNVATYSNITYNSNDLTFSNFSHVIVSYSNIEEDNDYTIVVSARSALNFIGSNISFSSVNTGIDKPLLNAERFFISDDGDMTISVTNIRVDDKSSPVDLYYAIFLNDDSDGETLKDFYTSNSNGICLTSNGPVSTQTSFDISNEHNFYQSSDSDNSNAMHPGFTSYYVNLFAIDQYENYTVLNSSSLTFPLNDFGNTYIVTQPSGWIVSQNQTMTFTWNTLYNSESYNFDCTVMGSDFVAKSNGDSRTWTLSNVAVPDDWGDVNSYVAYDIKYVGFQIEFPADNQVYIDVTEPTMLLGINHLYTMNNMSTHANEISFSNISFELMSSHESNVISGDFTNYTFEFFASNEDTRRSVTFTDAFPSEPITITGLIGSTFYNMGVKITDAAGNVFETAEGSRPVLQTLDSTPITTNITSQEVYSEGINLGYKLEGELFDNIPNDVYMFLSDNSGFTMSNMEAAMSNSDLITNPNERSNVIYSMDSVTSNVGGSFSNIVLTKYYSIVDDIASLNQIITGDKYYVNYYLIDSETHTVKQKNISSELVQISQSISFVSFESSNVYDPTLAYYDETLTLKFSTKYAEMVERFTTVEIGGESPLVSLTSDDISSNQSWTVSHSLTSEGVKGFTVNLQDGGSLGDTTAEQRITIQNQLYLNEPINNTSSQTRYILQGDLNGTTPFLDTVISDTNDVILLGGRLFDVTLSLAGEGGHVNDVVLENIFYDGGSYKHFDTGIGVINNFTFSNLVEGGRYTPSVTISMSNNFLSSNVTNSNISYLNSENPTISFTTGTSIIPIQSGALRIDVNTGGVTFNDSHTNFTTHLFLHENSPANVNTFINSPEYNRDNIDSHLINSNNPLNVEFTPSVSLTHYYDAANVRTLLTGRLSDYNVYAYVEDDVGNYFSSYVRRSIGTEDLITHVTLTTDTGRNYVKTGDTVYLKWKTKYIVEGADFAANVTLMGETVVSVLNGSTWETSNVVKLGYTDGAAPFDISLFGVTYGNSNLFLYTPETSPRVIEDVYIDNTLPIFTFDYNTPSVSSSNIAFSFPAFLPLEVLDNGDMKLEIQMTKISYPSVSNTSSFIMSSNMDINSTFNVTGLDDNTQYHVSATITDYAQNVSLITHMGSIYGGYSNVWTDTRIPFFINENATASPIGSHRISVSNIAVYDSYHSCSLYVCAIEHEYTVEHTYAGTTNTTELYTSLLSLYISQSTQNNAIQILPDISDNRDNVETEQLGKVYLFTHAINAKGIEVRIKEDTDYDIFSFSTVVEHGDTDNVAFGGILNVTTPTFVSVVKPYDLSDLISSVGTGGGGVYETTEGFFGSSSNIMLEITTNTLENSVFNGSSHILYQLEHLPVSTAYKDFTYMIDFTFKSLSEISSENMIFHQGSTHKLFYDKGLGVFKLTWGVGTIDIPLSLTLGISTQIGLSIDTTDRAGKILLSVNGSVYTTEYAATISQHTSFLIGNTPTDSTTGLNGTLNYVFFWTRRFLTGKEICKAFLSHNKVLEYTFDTFDSSSGGYRNERYASLPLHTNSEVGIETIYPRIGGQSIVLSTTDGYLYNNDITSAKVNGNDITVMFWFMTSDSKIPMGIMELSTERNEKISMKITNDNNKTRMVIDLTNEMGVVHSVVSQKLRLEDNTWYHLSFALTDTSVLFYLNGKFKGSSLEAMTGPHTDFRDKTFFKKLQVGSLNTLINTKIDHLVIYNKALNRQKILFNYEAVLQNQMLLRYNFEILKESEIATIVDESINTNNGVLVGIDNTSHVITNETPMSANAITLDGITQYIDIDHNPMLDLTNVQNSTFSAWIKLDSNSVGYQPIVSKNNEYRLGIDFNQISEGITSLQIGDGDRFYSTPASREITSYSNLEYGLNTIVNPISATSDDIISYGFQDGSLYSSHLTLNTVSTNPPISTVGIVPSSGKVNSNALSFNGSNNYMDLGSNLLSDEGDLDEITFSAWIKINSEDMFMDNVIISRTGSFMFGVKAGDLYLKEKFTPSLINSTQNLPTFIGKLNDPVGVSVLSISDLFVGHASIDLESKYSIVATTGFLNKSKLIELVEDRSNKFTTGQIFTTGNTIASQNTEQIRNISFSNIIDTSSNEYENYTSIDTFSVNNVYVYVYAQTIDNPMDDVYRFNVNTSIDNTSLHSNPFVTVSSVKDPTSTGLIIATPHVFSSKSIINKVFAFTFVTGGAHSVSIDTLTDDAIKTFVHDYLVLNSNITSDGMYDGAISGASVVYATGFSSVVGARYSPTSILPGTSELSFNRAYNTLTPLDYNTHTTQITVSTDIFTPIVVAIDENLNYGIYMNKGEWILLNRDTVVNDGLLDHNNSPQNTNNIILDSGIESYSRLKDMFDGTGSMTDSLINTPYNGINNYLFKWVPSQTPFLKDDPNHFKPNDTNQYFQWTQTNNPTSVSTITELSNLTYMGHLCVLQADTDFEGMYKAPDSSESHRYITAIKLGSSSSVYFLSINPEKANPQPTSIKWISNSSSTLENIYHSELYVWMGPKQASHYQSS